MVSGACAVDSTSYKELDISLPQFAQQTSAETIYCRAAMETVIGPIDKSDGQKLTETHLRGAVFDQSKNNDSNVTRIRFQSRALQVAIAKKSEIQKDAEQAFARHSKEDEYEILSDFPENFVAKENGGFIGVGLIVLNRLTGTLMTSRTAFTFGSMSFQICDSKLPK